MSYNFSSYYHYHKDKYGSIKKERHMLRKGNCNWCNVKLPEFGGLKIDIGIEIYEGIPYCSAKCRSEDPDSDNYISEFIRLTPHLKANYLNDMELGKRLNNRREEAKRNQKLESQKLYRRTLLFILIVIAFLILICNS